MSIATKNVIALVVLFLCLIAGAWLVIMPAPEKLVDSNTSTTTTPTPTPTPVTPPPTSTNMQVKIALLDTTGESSGKQVGCDKLMMATRVVAKDSAVLNSALRALFAEPAGTQPSKAYNFIARTRDTLKYDHVTLENGTANIYLTGSLSGLAGTCDDPRAAIQLEETAKQFATVQRVHLYLNGERVSLRPSSRGDELWSPIIPD